MPKPLRPEGETREEGIQRIMRDLGMDRRSAEIFYDLVEGMLNDIEEPTGEKPASTEDE